MPEEEITERIIQTRGNLNPGEDDPNQPPVVKIAPVAAAAAGQPVALTALVTDDGLPKPRAAPQARSSAIPSAQSNSATAVRPRGLTVAWFEYGGPGQAVFDPAGPIAVSNGQARTMARFAVPETYILRAIANDGALETSADITITVGSTK